MKSYGFIRYRLNDVEERSFKESSFVDKNDNILNEIYAPDPNTGFPRSDISVILSHSTDPVVTEFVNKVILSPSPSENYGDNKDIALELVRQYGENESSYIDRLQSIIKDYE